MCQILQPVVCCLTYIPPNSNITPYENLLSFLIVPTSALQISFYLAILTLQISIGTHYLVFPQSLVSSVILFLILGYLNLLTVLMVTS